MGTTRYTDGNVTVTLDDGLEKLVRRSLEAVAGETVRILEAAAEDVAGTAREAWYDVEGGRGVHKRTGRSGRVEVVTTVSDSEVRVSVGSTDLERAKYIHRPGRLSTVAVEIDKATYYEAKRKGGPSASLVFHAKKDDKDAGVEAGRYYKKTGSPDASDGRYLLVELLRKPGQARIKAVLPELGQAVARKAGGA